MKDRQRMVREQIMRRGVTDKRVLAAIEKVPRHHFVPSSLRGLSYTDGPLPIGMDQTISQPYIVALMTELLALSGDEKVLEIGTGSGYQAAVLAELTDRVYTIEVRSALADRAEETLRSLGYESVTVKTGDGFLGWPEHAPYDAIIVTCAPHTVPPVLFEQLKEGGRMVIPVGEFFQELKLIEKRNGSMYDRDIMPVRFVPMVHETEP